MWLKAGRSFQWQRTAERNHVIGRWKAADQSFRESGRKCFIQSRPSQRPAQLDISAVLLSAVRSTTCQKNRATPRQAKDFDARSYSARPWPWARRAWHLEKKCPSYPPPMDEGRPGLERSELHEHACEDTHRYRILACGPICRVIGWAGDSRSYSNSYLRLSRGGAAAARPGSVQPCDVPCNESGPPDHDRAVLPVAVGWRGEF